MTHVGENPDTKMKKSNTKNPKICPFQKSKPDVAGKVSF